MNKDSNFGLEKLSDKDLLMDDSKIKRNFDMDDLNLKNNRMDLNNYSEKINFKNENKSDDKNKESKAENANKNKDELLNISESS